MGRALGDIVTLAVLLGGGYVIYTQTDWFQKGIATVKDFIGEVKGGLSGGGGAGRGGGPITGGGAISQTGSCPGGQTCGPCRPQSGGIRCECDGVKSAAYEATFCGTWSGDDLSIKMWGPQHHSSADCCWCILSVSPDGVFGIRQEGPHPSTGSKSGNSSIGGKPSCVKGVISPGPKGAHVEGWGLVNGTWKKAFVYDGPCGLNKKSTTPSANQQVSFRCDGQLSTKCATVRPIANANYTSAGQYTSSLFTNNRPYLSSKILNVI